MPKATLRDIPINGKRLLIRVDFNVPLNPDGQITDDTRIQAVLPTIRYALEHGARVVLASHLGRPNGRVEPALSLRPVSTRLEDLLGKRVEFATDCVGEAVEQQAETLAPGGVLLLENVRFHPEEEANDPVFAQFLARLGDAYINDAFGTAHRAHASTAGIAAVLQPAVAGLLMETEMIYLSKATDHPEAPFVAILGGAKVADKLPLITNLLDRVTSILIGGGMAYTLLQVQGYAIGGSLVDSDHEALACDVFTRASEKNVNLVLPCDHVMATSIAADAVTQLVADGGIPDGWMGLDIGPQTIQRFRDAVAPARTVLWNGPMGVFECEPFRQGTVAMAQSVAACAGTTIVGGGDTVAALDLAGCREAITHVSTGGGASLEFLEGKALPGIVCLNEC